MFSCNRICDESLGTNRTPGGSGLSNQRNSRNPTQRRADHGRGENETGGGNRRRYRNQYFRQRHQRSSQPGRRGAHTGGEVESGFYRPSRSKSEPSQRQSPHFPVAIAFSSLLLRRVLEISDNRR